MPTIMSNEEYLDFKQHVNCKWMKCLAGMGLAGNGQCFLDGEYDNKNCSKFTKDEEGYRIRRKV